MFTYCWCFLELFIEKFILNINNERAQDYSCPGATFAFCSHGEKLPRQGGLPASRSCPGATKNSHSYRRQTMHRGKVDPGVSELPRGNELSRDHVNRSLEIIHHEHEGQEYKSYLPRDLGWCSTFGTCCYSLKGGNATCVQTCAD